MGCDLSLDYHWYNETRFALPFLSMQDRFTGDMLAISRPKADVKPLDGSQPSRIYHSNPDYSVGSLGFGRRAAFLWIMYIRGRKPEALKCSAQGRWGQFNGASVPFAGNCAENASLQGRVYPGIWG